MDLLTDSFHNLEKKVAYSNTKVFSRAMSTSAIPSGMVFVLPAYLVFFHSLAVYTCQMSCTAVVWVQNTGLR